MRNTLEKSVKKNSNHQFSIGKLQSEDGILSVPLFGELTKESKGTAYMWANSLRGYIEQGMIEYSGRIANQLVNSLLHRRKNLDDIKLRTLTDLVEKEGTRYYQDQLSWADSVLTSNGYSLETLLPQEDIVIDHGILDENIFFIDSEGNRLTREERHSMIDETAKRINETRPEEQQIDIGSFKTYQIEPDASNSVKICLDGVSVKRQKDNREKAPDSEDVFTYDTKDGPEDYTRAPDPKKRPKVETAVGHVEYRGQKYLFAGRNMFDTCKLILAFLISKDLLTHTNLIFFTDGGKDIRYCIDNIFKIYNPIEVLDWFHLRKHCNEGLSMSLVGGKANRQMQYAVKRNLFRILWSGNVQNAISYLRSLDSECIKSENRLDDLIGYLNKNESRIACYVLRRKFGLQISSNKVEKANDMIVASRQKGNSMSWSREGSWGLANITVKYLNKEADTYRKNGTLLYEMYDDYGKIFDLKTDGYIAC